MIRLYCLGAVAVVTALAGCVPVAPDPQPDPAPPARAEPDAMARIRAAGRPTPGPVSARYADGGVVTAVNARSVTIRGIGNCGLGNAKLADQGGTDYACRWIRMDPTKPIRLVFPGWEIDLDRYQATRDGAVATLLTGEEVVLLTADQPTRTYPAAQRLQDGSLPYPRLTLRKHVHLLSDVRVGDRVGLELDGPLWKEECVTVQIHRRPGWRVPYPGHRDDQVVLEVVDEANAHQAHEDFGTPIPDQFRPDRHIRRFADRPAPPADPRPPAKRP